MRSLFVMRSAPSGDCLDLVGRETEGVSKVTVEFDRMMSDFSPVLLIGFVLYSVFEYAPGQMGEHYTGI